MMLIEAEKVEKNFSLSLTHTDTHILFLFLSLSLSLYIYIYIYIYIPTRLHKQDVTRVQFFQAEFNWFEFCVFFLLAQLPYEG